MLVSVGLGIFHRESVKYRLIYMYNDEFQTDVVIFPCFLLLDSIKIYFF